MESEKTAKWQYTRHCEDLSVEIKKLREEVGCKAINGKTLNNKGYYVPTIKLAEIRHYVLV